MSEDVKPRFINQEELISQGDLGDGWNGYREVVMDPGMVMAMMDPPTCGTPAHFVAINFRRGIAVIFENNPLIDKSSVLKEISNITAQPTKGKFCKYPVSKGTEDIQIYVIKS